MEDLVEEQAGPSPAAPEHDPAAVPSPTGRPVAGAAAAAVLGAALAVLVVRDGSPGWQVVRGVVVVALASGLTVEVARGRGRRRAAAAFVAGGVGIAIGVGIGLPHLAKGGAPVIAVAGLTALAAGVVLAVIGGVGLVRSVRGWRRFVLTPILVAVVLVGLLVIGQAVAATNVAPTSLAATTPIERGFAYTDVDVPTADGVTLSGWYLPSDNRAAVVLLHGSGSTRSDVLDQAVALAGRGYGVLLLDARGHGRSTGRAMDLGWYGDEDVRAGVSFLADQRDVDPQRIGVVGMSMGGEEAIGAAAADPRIAAVVAEGATTRVAADKSWLTDEYGWQGVLQQQLDRLTTGLTDLLTDADPPVPLRDAVRAAAPRPVLLIAGGAVPDEVLADRYIQSGSPDTVELWVAPDAGHTGALARDPDAWVEQVDAFLTGALHPDGT